MEWIAVLFTSLAELNPIAHLFSNAVTPFEKWLLFLKRCSPFQRLAALSHTAQSLSSCSLLVLNPASLSNGLLLIPKRAKTPAFVVLLSQRPGHVPFERFAAPSVGSCDLFRDVLATFSPVL